MRLYKSKKVLRSFSAFILILSLVLCSFASVPASAKTTNQMRDEISELEEKSKKIEAEISKLKKEKAEQQVIRNALDEQLDNTQAKIAACTSLIASYNREISAFEKEIEQKQREIEETKFLYKKRIRSIYMTGSTNNQLLILLDSENFSDYLALSEVSKTISAHDKKIVNTIIGAIEEINKSKIEINKKIEEQNKVKTTLANEQAKLKSQQSEINGVINTINNDQSVLEKENKEYEKAINALESEIQAAIAAANKGNSTNITNTNPVFVSGQFTWPVPGYYNITSNYGQRWGRLHGGIDISSAGIRGKQIVAAADGVVIAAGWNTGGFGNWVMINHGVYNGKQYSTVYAHMISTPVVSTGQTVKAGQHIGNVGTTGWSYGNHLHFEVRVNGSRTNPMNYFSRAK